MTDEEYADAFELLTGNKPFPWQVALYRKFVAGEYPATATLPTGLGKTMVIAVWLLALATAPSGVRVPRRLVYVVNRRTVVDQSTDVARDLRTNLTKVPEIRSALRALCTVPVENPLAISTLRGQFADNREWRDDPTRPAVICGTVDMLGSRLLFNGYGIGRYDRAHEVGLLGCDTLLVHDEAHLTDPFQCLLRAINGVQSQERAQGRGLRVLELTATAVHREGDPPPFGLTPADHEHPIVRERLDAVKTITLHEAARVTPDIVTHAAAHRSSGRAVLVFVQTPDQVQEVQAALVARPHSVPKGNIATLTGTMRGYERDQLVATNPVFARFAPTAKPCASDPTVYLICTSAGEVGIDISADDMVCDLSTFESMAQRFGRVNRRGGIDPRTNELRYARIDIVHEPEIDTGTRRGEHRLRTLGLLRRLFSDHQASVSPRTLGKLTDAEKYAAFSPRVPTCEATDILLDSWALTSITGDLPGRPEVADWLHGLEPKEQPTTSVAWREDVTLLSLPSDASDEAKAARLKALEEYLDEYPLKPHEQLSERTARLVSVAGANSDETGKRQHLKEFARRMPDLPAWVIDVRGRVSLTTIGELAEYEFEGLMNRTLVLPPAAGGLSVGGMLDGKAGQADDLLYDVADAPAAGSPQSRHRAVVSVNDEGEQSEHILGDIPLSDPASGFNRLVCEITLADSEEGESSRRFEARVSVAALEGEQSRSRQSPHQLLADHLERAGNVAAVFSERLMLSGPERKAVPLAAKWHDLGKDRDIWQRGVGNTTGKAPWAKSGKKGRIHGLNSYRHEFGSLLDILSDKHPNHAEFAALDEDERELVLHLIAAHHGRARPHFTTDEAFDTAYAQPPTDALARVVPQRFGRLQRKYGRWGLAYLESLVRAADILASQPAPEGQS